MAQSILRLKTGHRLLLNMIIVRLVTGVIGSFVVIFGVIMLVRFVVAIVVGVIFLRRLFALIVVAVVFIFGDLLIQGLVIVWIFLFLDARILFLRTLIVLTIVALCKSGERTCASSAFLNTRATTLLASRKLILRSPIFTVWVYVRITWLLEWVESSIPTVTNQVDVTLCGKLHVSHN